MHSVHILRFQPFYLALNRAPTMHGPSQTVHGFVESQDRSEADLKLALDNTGTMCHSANADREGQPPDRS